jgi:hypothetical protein
MRASKLTSTVLIGAVLVVGIAGSMQFASAQKAAGGGGAGNAAGATSGGTSTGTPSAPTAPTAPMAPGANGGSNNNNNNNSAGSSSGGYGSSSSSSGGYGSSSSSSSSGAGGARSPEAIRGACLALSGRARGDRPWAFGLAPLEPAADAGCEVLDQADQEHSKPGGNHAEDPEIEKHGVLGSRRVAACVADSTQCPACCGQRLSDTVACVCRTMP